ncbi:MAG TPA: acyl carrier protein [Conexibacter sp.]|nr:acyl carrier protein [Conexibacter sp.]
MTREEVVALLRELLGEILELDPQELDFEQDLIDDLDTDSLQRLELMTEVEHRLDVRLDARAWREARTLTELTELTLRELAESPSR